MSAHEHRYKYPKTFHFDFSQGLQNDDRRLESTNGFIGKRIIITEKIDGENATLYEDYYHPRSVYDSPHPSRSWIRKLQGEIGYLIPKGWRVCGENMFAEHSIVYDELESYFYCFNIWNEKNICLSWDETVEYCNLLGINHVKVLYDGIYNYDIIKNIYENLNFKKQEGIVCRVADEFHYDDFQQNYAKAVRKGHVQTDEHWMEKVVVPNKLK
jgi:ATP-dependent RNA circularization protein (DNA/RNA ligase family)